MVYAVGMVHAVIHAHAHAHMHACVHLRCTHARMHMHLRPHARTAQVKDSELNFAVLSQLLCHPKAVLARFPFPLLPTPALPYPSSPLFAWSPIPPLSTP